MATVKERLETDQVKALKAGDKIAVQVLRTVRSEMQFEEKKSKTQTGFDDSKAIAFIQQKMKQRLETAEEFTAIGQVERAEVERSEAAVLAGYLPTQLPEAEVEAAIVEVLAGFENPTKRDFKELISRTREKVGNGTDGKTISAILNRHIA